MAEDALGKIISSLWDRFGRAPTEDEVMTIIFGDDDAKHTIWNKENKEHG